MSRTSLAATVLALATLPMSGEEFPTPRLTDVFVAGEGVYHTYRIHRQSSRRRRTHQHDLASPINRALP